MIKALPKHKKYSLHPNLDKYMYLDTLSLAGHLSLGMVA